MKKITYLLTAFLILGISSCQCPKSSDQTTPNLIRTAIPERPAGQTDVIGLRCAPLDTVRVGFIGLGMRGPGAVYRFTQIEGTAIKALCDLYPERVEKAQEILIKNNRPQAAAYSGEEGWKQLCERPDIDLVYIVTPWLLHTPIAVYAMEHGKHVAIEVPAAMNLDECWQLINTSEKTRKHCMMLENCVYDFFELTTLNMAQHGLFGDILHVEGSYIHNLEEFWAAYQGNWRLDFNEKYRGDVYATHGMGPACQLLDIHRGNKMNYLVSMDTKALTGPKLVEKINKRDGKDFQNGDRKRPNHAHPARRHESPALFPDVPTDRHRRFRQQVSGRRLYIPFSGAGRRCTRSRKFKYALVRPGRCETGADGAIQTPHSERTGGKSQKSRRTRWHGLHHGLPVGILFTPRPPSRSRCL